VTPFRSHDPFRTARITAVLTAALFGLAASSALVIGAAVGSFWDPPRQVTGVLLAFASGALISALAVELFGEAFELGGAVRAGLGLLAGAAAFVTADTVLDRYVTGRSDPEQREVASAGSRRGVGLALLAAVTLDGVPENLALGVSLVTGASLTLLVAIFFSNLPESLVGAVAMRAGGQGTRSVLTTWTLCALLLAAAVVFGRVLAGGLSDNVLAVALAFAGGAVLASLADTLMPEAFEHGRPFNAFATAAGFFLSFVLAA
jgi:ZIP family zinc transporter